MPCQTHLPILACLICSMAMPDNLWAQFTGAFADGTRFQNVQLAGWSEGKELPRLQELAPDGKKRDLGTLFEAKNPVSWLFNEHAEAPAASRPCVELFGGDRLPGQVIGFRYGTELPVDRQPAHLLVKIDPDAVQSPHAVVRVRSAAVRKVVWQPRHSDRYTPCTLFLRDGQQIRFRALRWTSEAVMLLLKEGGARRVAFAEIAELHLPRRDPWRAFQETLAILSPDCTTRLLRVETSRGLVLTSTMDRSRVSGARLFQPAWCLEPIGFELPQLRWSRCFWPHEVPLSLLEPLRVEQRSPLQGARSWQADRNVKLQPLRSGGKLHSDGFGMLADSELEFELSPLVRAFHTRIGLDELAGRGGCGRGRVHVNSSADKPLWQSEVLVGAGEVLTANRLSLRGPEQGEKTLVLVAESPADRPVDADPLNIRSFVDWLEPRVELDLERLREEVQRLVPEMISAWQGWTVSTPDGRFRVSPRWDIHHLPATRLIPDVVLQRGTLLLSRQVEVRPEQKYLCMSLAQEPGPSSGRVEVRVDDRPVAELTVPQWEKDAAGHWLTPAASFVPLAKYRGKTVKITVEYHPTKESGTVEWRGLEFVPSKDLVVWTPVQVVAARAAAPETTLVKEADHTLFAPVPDPKKVPKTDTYTIVGETSLAEISAIRLELLPDPRLPSKGPGRSWDGEVFLSEFKMTAAPRNKPDQARDVTLTAEGTDFSPGNPPANTVDGDPESGWNPVPAGRNVPSGRKPMTHVIVFTPAQNIAFPGGARLTFRLEQNLAVYDTQAHRPPGRFRLLVTSAPRPVPVARPGIVLEPQRPRQ